MRCLCLHCGQFYRIDAAVDPRVGCCEDWLCLWIHQDWAVAKWDVVMEALDLVRYPVS